jgi:hypothetical protein
MPSRKIPGYNHCFVPPEKLWLAIRSPGIFPACEKLTLASGKFKVWRELAMGCFEKYDWTSDDIEVNTEMITD